MANAQLPLELVGNQQPVPPRAASKLNWSQIEKTSSRGAGEKGKAKGSKKTKGDKASTAPKTNSRPGSASRPPAPPGGSARPVSAK